MLLVSEGRYTKHASIGRGEVSPSRSVPVVVTDTYKKKLG